MWPAEPVVALAYRDQLVRSGVLSSSRSEELSAALADAQGLIDAVGRDARVAGKLRSLAVTFNDEAESARGVSRDRLIALSGSLEVIADRL